LYIDSLATEIDLLNSKARENTIRNEEMAKQQASLLETTETLRTELAEAKLLVERAKVEKERLQVRLDAEVSQLDDKNKLLWEQINSLTAESQKELDGKNNSLLEVQAELERKNVVITTQQEQIEKINQVNAEYLSTVNSAAATNADLVQEIASLREQAKEITQSRDNFEKDCVSVTSKLSELREEHEKISGLLKYEMEATKQMSTAVVAGEKRAVDLEIEIDELRKANDLIVKKLEEELRVEASKQTTAAAEWNTKEVELTRELEGIKANMETRLTKQQEGFDNMKAGLMAEVRRLDDAHVRELRENNEKIESLSNDVDKYKNLYADAQKAMDAAKAQLQTISTPSSKDDETDSQKPSESEEKPKQKERSSRVEAKQPKSKGSEKRQTEKEDKSKDNKKRSSKSISEFFVSPNEVPTELESEEESASQDTIKKKRKLQPKPANFEAPSSPSKRVRFMEGTKKAVTYTRQHKVTPKSRGSKDKGLDDDVFTFKG